MIERFSESARRAIAEAQASARELGHSFVASEHLLLGVVKVGAAGDAGLARLTEEVVAVLGPPAAEVDAQVPFTPAAKRCLERVGEHTTTTVGPEHVLAALLEDEDMAALAARCGVEPQPAHRRRGAGARGLMPELAGWATLLAGTALLFAPRRSSRLLGLDGEEVAVRAIGVSDLVLVPGLLRGRPRWPWMAARAAFNLGDTVYLLLAASRSASPVKVRAGAAVMAALTVVDGRTASVLRRGP